MNFQQLEKIEAELGKKKDDFLVLLAEEPYFERRLYARLKCLYGDPLRDPFRAERLDLDQRPAGESLDHLQTLPLLASEKVFYLFGLENVKADELARLEQGLLGEKSGMRLFIFLRKVDKRKNFFKKLLAAAKVLELPAIEKGDIGAWAKAMAAQRGARLTSEALDHLQEVLAPDLLLLDNEIEKLTTAAGPGKVVDLPLAESLVGGLYIENIFEIGERLGQKKTKPAFALLQKILAGGEEGLMLNGLLARHFRILRLARRGQGEKGGALVRQAFHVNPYFLPRYLQQARAFTAAALDEAVQLFYRNDRRLKTGEEAADVFADTFFRLCRSRR